MEAQSSIRALIDGLADEQVKIKERIHEIEEKANGEPLDEFLTQQNDGKSDMMTITMA